MQLYHKYRQSDHTREDSVNEKAVLSSAVGRELLLADMLVNMVPADFSLILFTGKS